MMHGWLMMKMMMVTMMSMIQMKMIMITMRMMMLLYDRPCMTQSWAIMKMIMMIMMIMMMMMMMMMMTMIFNLSHRPCIMHRWVMKVKKLAKTGCTKTYVKTSPKIF